MNENEPKENQEAMDLLIQLERREGDICNHKLLYERISSIAKKLNQFDEEDIWKSGLLYLLFKYDIFKLSNQAGLI